MLRGSIVALVTPFTAEGDIDEAALKALIDWQHKKGTDGILVCGTTGESATLSHDEHKRIIKSAVEYCAGRIPVVAGCGSNSTREALELAEYSQKIGADYALVITPYYNKPTQEGLYRHFQKISESVDIPVIIYNVPSRTGVNIAAETVARLYKDCENIIGVKEASGSLDQITKIMTLVDEDFVLLSGSDEINLPILSVGAKGAISVVANIMPKETHDLIGAFLENKLSESLRLQLYLYDIIKILFIETNPIPVKTALSMMGLAQANFRLPLCAMAEDNLKKLESTLKRYNLI